MSLCKACLLAVVVAIASHTSASAQMDPIAYVEAIANYYGQQAAAAGNEAVLTYRQQSGDWSTPDQQVLDYLIYQSRQQNPGWYADLKQREANFQQQQSQYVANSNAALDNLYNGYMQRSQWQYQSHQDYVRENIWERSQYMGNNGNVYELPYYQPYQQYEANDGSQFTQDQWGNYYQYDNAGWGSQMYPYNGY
jgi:hypothetical protein